MTKGRFGERKKDEPEKKESLEQKRNRLAQQYYRNNYSNLCNIRKGVIDDFIKSGR